ncbi:M23 family metallopeptidase [Paenarthrobacter ureafaciens]|uniref:M23 family metallopeptidase n=1 Tax=Paenarthrobacter ureafaciens TaxID=37931 RepID=UPI003464D874
MPEQKSGGMIALIAIPGLALGLVFSGVLLGGSESAAACNPDGSGNSISIDPGTVPDTTISGYGHEQLVNATQIIQAGKDLDLGVRDQTIGVMTAMGESGLRVIDHGDAAGPDSRGLFQQRDNGAWGAYGDRMDAYASSTNFFKALMKIEDRESLAPTIAAHRVQINADPYHYEKYWDAAVAVVEGLSGVETGLKPGNGNNVCSGGDTESGEVNPNGWAKPGDGPITAGFGPRDVIQTGSGPTEPFHFGTDFQADGCDGPIWAAQAGTVSQIVQDSGGGWHIEVDHGGGVATRYIHMYANGILVEVGDKVKAGQQIARTGSSGFSTGCHLHFEVQIEGEKVDPIPFLAEVGITY